MLQQGINSQHADYNVGLGCLCQVGLFQATDIHYLH